jgi:uncharacterized protein (DUF1499 family)
MLKLRFIFSALLLLAVVFGSATPISIAAPINSVEITEPSADIALGGSMFSFSGVRPDNLGVQDGKLAACPDSPNCVSSQGPDTDQEHYIAPLTYSSTPAEAMAALKAVIKDMDRTAIIQDDGNYLYAEFTSAIMGFVDDVEFYLDEGAGVIHVRSASRLGKSDLGVNRKRVEEIREKFA